MAENKGRRIPFIQAPCEGKGGVITSDGQEEAKGATCRCPEKPEIGCCVDGMGVIIPRMLKLDYGLEDEFEKQNLLDIINANRYILP